MTVSEEYALRNNQVLPLVDYLVPLVGKKKKVKILDVGSGPYPTTGQTLDGVDIEVTYCDRKDFKEFWKKLGKKPLFPVEVEDMEALSYKDKTFDIVHCMNALDHTPDAQAAVNEMLRVSKGWVYIQCALIQRTTSGKSHYWDAKEDGTFTSDDDEFNLKDFGFEIEFVDNGGERRYNHIIARRRK